MTYPRCKRDVGGDPALLLDCCASSAPENSWSSIMMQSVLTVQFARAQRVLYVLRSSRATWFR